MRAWGQTPPQRVGRGQERAAHSRPRFSAGCAGHAAAGRPFQSVRGTRRPGQGGGRLACTAQTNSKGSKTETEDLTP